MLDNWLRNCDLERQNWSEVARALRQIKYHQLAKEIDKTGHYYDDDNQNSIMCDTDKVQGLHI